MPDNLVDPLLVLLRRHEQARYDAAADSNASEAEREPLFAACERTMQTIIDRAPAATTATGAAAALDHVLNDDALWHGSQYSGEIFLRHLSRPRVTTSIALPRDDRTGSVTGSGWRHMRSGCADSRLAAQPPVEPRW
jgi:hypothetical protein